MWRFGLSREGGEGEREDGARGFNSGRRPGQHRGGQAAVAGLFLACFRLHRSVLRASEYASERRSERVACAAPETATGRSSTQGARASAVTMRPSRGRIHPPLLPSLNSSQSFPKTPRAFLHCTWSRLGFPHHVFLPFSNVLPPSSVILFGGALNLIL